MPALAVEYDDWPSLPRGGHARGEHGAAAPVRVLRGAPDVERGLGKLHRGGEVERDGEVPVAALDAREGGIAGHPRVGDEGIELAVGLHRPVHHRPVEALGGHVATEANRAAVPVSGAELARDRVGDPGVDVVDDHVGALGGEPLHRGPPDPVAGPGHDDRVALETPCDRRQLLDLFKRPAAHQCPRQRRVPAGDRNNPSPSGSIYGARRRRPAKRRPPRRGTGHGRGEELQVGLAKRNPPTLRSVKRPCHLAFHVTVGMQVGYARRPRRRRPAGRPGAPRHAEANDRERNR